VTGWLVTFCIRRLPGIRSLKSIETILENLPHRYPILLIDRLLEVNEDLTFGRSLKNVTYNEPFFQGHYPGMPIMPGVLIVEAMAQTIAAVMLLNPSYKGMLPILAGLDAVRFKRKVVPGDQLIIDINVLWVRGSIGKGSGIAKVDGVVAAAAEITFKLSERNI
jgi:beta-hydroxyacyl-ACP dehydratase FabZ